MNNDRNEDIDRHEEREERTRQWQERTIAQYRSYKYPTLRATVALYYQLQERRLADENRVRLLLKIGTLPDEVKEIMAAADKSARKEESMLAKQIEKQIADIPIYRDYLAGVKGVGPILSGCLIAYIQDIGKFDTISALHRYCGLSAIDGKAQRRALGSHIDYNPKLKTLMFKVGSSFIKSKNAKYRAVYDDAHQQYEKRGKWSKENPTGNKNKLHTMFRSMKKMERIFVANVWVRWRELEGLPVSDPYIFAIGGHDRQHLIRA